MHCVKLEYDLMIDRDGRGIRKSWRII